MAAADPAPAASPREVWLRGKAGKLQTWLWCPPGAGPFPALVYNHGSESDPLVGTYEPSVILRGAMRAKKLPQRVRIFPRFGENHMDGHAGFCMRGADVWGADVLDFLRNRR